MRNQALKSCHRMNILFDFTAQFYKYDSEIEYFVERKIIPGILLFYSVCCLRSLIILRLSNVCMRVFALWCGCMCTLCIPGHIVTVIF